MTPCCQPKRETLQTAAESTEVFAIFLLHRWFGGSHSFGQPIDGVGYAIQRSGISLS